MIEELEERGALSSIVEVDEDGLTPLGLANAEGGFRSDGHSTIL